MTIKSLGKNLLCNLLERQVKQLISKNEIKIIAVAGSVGKTSTKLAIAKTLTQKYKVIYQDGNYNDRLTVPLIFFNQAEPAIFNILAWFKLILNNRHQIKTNYLFKLVVVELGTDGPGQLQHFAYLKPDLTILTAIDQEHMEYFASLDDVAREELVPLSFSKQVLINLDNVDKKYLPQTEFLTYSYDNPADFMVLSHFQEDLTDQKLEIKLQNNTNINIASKYLGSQGAKALLAAAAVAQLYGFSTNEITSALQALKPASGRMQVLAAINNSKIIDDSYNASPVAVKAAVEVLYTAKAAHKVAILGSMNELGQIAEKEHRGVADLLDPNKLDLLVTIGNDAKRYTAEVAKKRGLNCQSFADPISAGEYVKNQLKEDSLILVKGSQNRVFSEEAIKPLLANKADASKLVRQSDYWLKIKAKQFGY